MQAGVLDQKPESTGMIFHANERWRGKGPDHVAH
jgi:hypothetical protein